MKDETIMPDGRPLFAWRNEIEMLRSEAKDVESAKSHLGVEWALLDIIKIEQQREYHTGDYLFRITRADVMSSNNPAQILQKATIERL